MKKDMTKSEKQTRLQQAIADQELERQKNLRMMLSKGEITQEEFEQKICKK